MIIILFVGKTKLFHFLIPITIFGCLKKKIMKFAQVIETILLFDRKESNVAARDNHTAGTAMQSTSQKAAHGKNIFPVHRPRFWEILRFFCSG